MTSLHYKLFVLVFYHNFYKTELTCCLVRAVSALPCLKPFFSSLEWNRVKVNMKQRDFITAAALTFTALPSLKRKWCCLSASLMCWLSYQRRGLSGQSAPAGRTLPHSYQPLCRPLLTGAWHKSVCVCVCARIQACVCVCVARPPFRWVNGFKGGHIFVIRAYLEDINKFSLHLWLSVQLRRLYLVVDLIFLHLQEEKGKAVIHVLVWWAHTRFSKATALRLSKNWLFLPLNLPNGWF